MPVAARYGKPPCELEESPASRARERAVFDVMREAAGFSAKPRNWRVAYINWLLLHGWEGTRETILVFKRAKPVWARCDQIDRCDNSMGLGLVVDAFVTCSRLTCG